VNILVGKELEKSPFNCYLQVNVSVDFYLYSVIVRILYWHLIHTAIEKFYVFLCKPIGWKSRVSERTYTRKFTR